MTIGVVQTAAKTALSSTITATGGPNHSLVVIVSSLEETDVPSISGVTIGGVSLESADGQDFGGSGIWSIAWIYYLSNVASGQTAVVVSGSNLSMGSGGPPGGGVDIIELDCPITLDKSNHNAGSSTSGSSGATGTLTVPEEIAFGAVQGFSPTDTAGWTDVGTGNRSTAYKVVSATTSLNYTADLADSIPWSAVIATFRRGSTGVTPGGFMDCLV